MPLLQFNLTGLAPVVSGDVIRMGSSDSTLNVALTTTSSFRTPAKAGDTAITSKVDWVRGFPTLPDATQGDSTWLWQRRSQVIAGGATFLNAQTFAKSTDFTVRNGTGGTLTAALSAAPQTGSLPADIRWSRFAALASAVHPGATPTSDTFAAPFVAMEAVPQSLIFPNQPLFRLPGETLFIDFQFSSSNFEAPETFFVEASLTAPAPSSADVSYGTLAHAQFFDSVWHRAAQVFYAYDVPLAGNATQSFTISEAGVYREFVPRELLPNPIVPEIGPPVSPRINGNDAFAFQTGVGLQPVLSWSAPDRLNDAILGLGSPTYEANTVFGIFSP